MLSQSVARWIGLALCPFVFVGGFWASLRVALGMVADDVSVDEMIFCWLGALVLMGASFGSIVLFFSILAAGGP